MPWDAAEPNPLLVTWMARHAAEGAGRRALVIGCGLGRDAEYIAALGFRTTAFDISETALATARARFPESTVEYVVADLLAPPAAWISGYDLVVESITVQSMPLSVRDRATARVSSLVAPGGTLLVISGIRAEGAQVDGPPWPLTRSEIDAFATEELKPVLIEEVPRPDVPGVARWRAVFQRA
ncbi:class I SAM-dependent methyltransferase [Nocardia goodfellowii]|uniref:2-polyprenyl-3-methyl-5-hydroxy-6-metoxy-1, 4-benzoquinol methylase n=1 Tax=Nocardia goodfellowii TaxID=882446 RepID=A0ABS4QH91_9NOCA|nr:class I SAM-dependent methyltransferase [Nocardia goodfellowii]MBP2191062.1 2-polyprenyl-3-methyl-5-hydroxy-6-metoxy-1,4-benzoquinol methylase [Nocardia goodfellowii]